MGGDEVEEIGPYWQRRWLLSTCCLLLSSSQELPLLITGNCYGCFLLSPSQELPPLKKQAVVLEVLCLARRLVN